MEVHNRSVALAPGSKLPEDGKRSEPPEEMPSRRQVLRWTCSPGSSANVTSQEPPPVLAKPKGNQNRNNNHLNAISNIALEPSQPKAQAPLPEVTPPEPCLKPKLEGVLVNHKEPRPSSKLGLHVHFKLPDDKERETSSEENYIVLRHSLGNENSSYVASNAAGTITVESSLLKAPAFLPEATPPDPPGCLKPKLEGVLVNHNEPRSSSKAGLRVHFKLPEDNKEVASPEEGVLFAKQQKAVSLFDLVNGQSAGAAVPTAPVKEPPPVLAKPKLVSRSVPALRRSHSGAFGVSASALGAALRRFVQRFCAWCLVAWHLGFGACRCTHLDARRFGASTLSAHTSMLDASALDASALDARCIDARCTHLDARRFGARRSVHAPRRLTLRRSTRRHLNARCTHLDARCSAHRRLDARCSQLDARRFGASTLGAHTSKLGASALGASTPRRSVHASRRSVLAPRRFGARRLTLGACTSSSHVWVSPLCHLPGLQLASAPQTVDVPMSSPIVRLFDPEAPPLAGNVPVGHGLAPCHPGIGDAPVPLVGTGVIGKSQAWQSSRQKCPNSWR
ncbi:UNVERIFIED_CONTAM: hypothetical protein FKN15_024895 [Acipenser sinensis]